MVSMDSVPIYRDKVGYLRIEQIHMLCVGYYGAVHLNTNNSLQTVSHPQNK